MRERLINCNNIIHGPRGQILLLHLGYLGGNKKPLDRFKIGDKKYSFEDLAPPPATNLLGPYFPGGMTRQEGICEQGGGWNGCRASG
jgi:hypothetical protein